MIQAVQDPSLLDECNLDDQIKKVLLEQINIKLTQQAVKIRADIEVTKELIALLNEYQVDTTFDFE